jgi:hypothetical protein
MVPAPAAADPSATGKETVMSRLIQQVLLVGAAAAGLVALACMANSRCRRTHREELLDEALDESYPASDPPASQNFDIPANRQ